MRYRWAAFDVVSDISSIGCILASSTEEKQRERDNGD